MMTLLRSLLGAARSFLRTQRGLALENLALRHQIGVLERTVGKGRLQLGRVDRGFWAGLSRIWVGWEQALAIVQPATVIRCRREGFKRYSRSDGFSATTTGHGCRSGGNVSPRCFGVLQCDRLSASPGSPSTERGSLQQGCCADGVASESCVSCIDHTEGP
jgi:hypothetical protein